jgi:S1-C subfamily serine protease
MLRNGPDAAMRGPSPHPCPERAVHGESDRVKDQPLFEVDDTTTSYSPPRTVRPRWVDAGRAEAAAQLPAGPQVTAQHWFDPEPSTAQAPARDARPSSARGWSAPRRTGGPGRTRLVAGGVALALMAAGVASAGTVGVLALGGWLDHPAAILAVSPAPSAQRMQPVVVDRSDTSRAAAAVAPAVVTIVAGTSSDPLSELMTRTGSTPTIASGIIYDATKGLIITNRHVVCGAGSLAVLLADGRQLAGDVYGLDSLTDLAIVRIDPDDPRARSAPFPVANIGDSATLRSGQLSMAVGASGDSLTSTVTSGVISALGRDLLTSDPCAGDAPRSLRNLIQTDADVSDAGSGGALINALGDVVGINTSVAGAPAGANFAIPIDIAKPIMEQAAGGMPLSRPWMGITYTALTPAIAGANGLSIDHGAWLRGSADGSIPAVLPDSPADRAHLQEGDILTAIDDQRIDSAHPLDDILAQYRPEDQDPITVALLRDGTPTTVTLVLGSR